MNSIGTTQPAWDSRFGGRSPMLAPFAAAGAPLAGPDWPTLGALNALAAKRGGIASGGGVAIRFVAPEPSGGSSIELYEGRIHRAGEVPTRIGNWHDLFNALAWLAWPRAKAALNAAHVAAAARESGPRGRRRDALTLFDESGVAVATSATDLAALLTGFRWKELFWRERERVEREMRLFVFGHALAEKALSPFVGMTGHAIILIVEPEFFEAAVPAQMARADALLAQCFAGDGGPATPRDLAPLPVLGVPGWWAANESPGFYDDTGYFRPGRRG